jgi:regulator of protease activity HflC (stomatin/prohibitin superfamily)
MRVVIAAVFAFLTFVVLMTVVFGSWYTIDQGERGVILRNGAITATVGPGLGFKMPWIDDVEYISLQSHNKRFENVASYSKDQQPAQITISVNYHAVPDQVADLYARYGSLEGAESRSVDPRVYEQLKNVFGRFNAVTAIQDRARLNLEVEQALRSAITGPVQVESIQIENIDFSDAYEKSIEDRMLAEVEVQKLHQNAEREKVQAEIVVIQAKAKADAVRAEAEAEGAAIKIRGEAEATAIRVRGEALGQNPNLVLLTQAERWNGALPTTMVPGSTVPFLSVAGR